MNKKNKNTFTTQANNLRISVKMYVKDGNISVRLQIVENSNYKFNIGVITAQKPYNVSVNNEKKNYSQP